MLEKQAQQQRPESPTVILTWHACKYKVHKLHQMYIIFEDVLRSWLLCLYDNFGALIKSLCVDSSVRQSELELELENFILQGL